MALKSKDPRKVREDIPLSDVAPKKGVIRGNKEIITVGFVPELLEKIDAAAKANGISRAAFISLACSKALASQ